MRLVHIRIRDQVAYPGGRLRLEFSDGDTFLADEDVLPEKLNDPDPVRNKVLGQIQLSDDEIEWLARSLFELAADRKVREPLAARIRGLIDSDLTSGELRRALEEAIR